MTAQTATCPPQSLLADYGLGKLDPASAETVSRHIETCADCRQRVAAISGDSFVGRLRQADANPAPRRERTYVPGESLANAANSTDGSTSLGNRPRLPEASASQAGGAPADLSNRGRSLYEVSAPPELANHPDYELIKELGQGDMGTVYLARNRMMDRHEVLKVISKSLLDRPGALERFQQEIRSAAKLAHPNIVAAYSVLRPGELLVFAMEYVKGQDLSQVVKGRGYLPVANAAFYIHQVALGLQHAHEKGMVHRDIKPNNLMLAIEGKKHVVKILDFGLAKATSEKGAETGLTKSGQMLGTPDYVAPEQTLDAHKADIRADIYSLGCTLYFLLSGKPPFEETSLFEILKAHHERNPRPLNLVRPDVPVELAAVVGKMMAKKPENRYQTPGEVAKALVPFFKPGQALSTAPAAESLFAPPPVETPRGLGAATPAAPATPLPETLPSPVAVASPLPLATSGPVDLLGVTIEAHRPAGKRRAGWRRSLPPWQRCALAAVPAALALIFGVILLLPVKDGIIRVEIDDPQIEVAIKGTDIVLKQADNGHDVKLSPGEKTLVVERGDFKFETDKLILKKGTTVTVAVTFSAGELQVAQDGNVIGKHKLPEPTPPPPVVPLGAPPSPENAVASDDSEGWIPLFNGKDLTGWTKLGVEQSKVEVINGELDASNDHSVEAGYLVSDRVDFTDMHLRCEFLAGAGNEIAAVQLRTDPSWIGGGMRGYLLTIGRPENDAPGGASCATVLSLASHASQRFELARLTHAAPTVGQWHQLDLIVTDNRIQAMIDGECVIDHRDEGRTFRSGAVALWFSPKAKSRFRNIAIRTSTAGTEPEAKNDSRSRWVFWGVGNPAHDNWRVFQHAAGDRWIESRRHWPAVSRDLWTEVRRTDDFIDIERAEGAAKLCWRLRADRVEDGPDFDHLQPLHLTDKKWPGESPEARVALPTTGEPYVWERWWSNSSLPAKPCGATTDLLRLIDPTRDSVLGKWQIIEGRLVSRATNEAELDIPFDVPEEYYLQIVLQPPRDNDELFVGLPVGGSQALLSLAVGDQKVAGLELVDGRPAKDNATTRISNFLGRQTRLLECIVRKNHVEVLCGRLVVANWSGSPDRLSLPQPWKPSKPPRLFIGGRNGWVQIARLLLTPLDRVDKRPTEAVAKPSDGPIDLLKRVVPARDTIRGTWRFDGEALVSEPGWYSGIHVPLLPPDHYRITAVVSREPGPQWPSDIAIGFPVGGFHTMLYSDDSHVGFHLFDGKPVWENASRAETPVHKPGGDSATIICTVAEHHITVSVDGKQVIDWRGDPRRLSLDSVWAPVDWRKIFVGSNCPARFTKLQVEALEPEAAAAAPSKTENQNGSPEQPPLRAATAGVAAGPAPMPIRGSATTSADGKLTATEAFTLKQHTAAVTRVAFHRSLPLLASAGKDGQVLLWNLADRTPQTTLYKYPHTEIWAVKFSPDGRAVAHTSRFRGGSKVYFRTLSGQVLKAVSDFNKGGAVDSIAYSPDGRLFAAGQDDGGIRLWDLTQFQEIAPVSFGVGQNIHRLAFGQVTSGRKNETEYLLAAGGKGGVVRILTARLVKTKNLAQWTFSPTDVQFPKGAPVWGVRFSANGERLGFSREDGNVCLCDPGTGGTVRDLAPGARGKHLVDWIAFHPLRPWCVTAHTTDQAARIWNIESGELLCELKGHTGGVLCAEFSPDGRQVATASEDFSIKLWDLSGPEVPAAKESKKAKSAALTVGD